MTPYTASFLRRTVLTVLAGAFLSMTALPTMALEPAQPVKPELVVYKKTETAKGKPVQLRLHVFKPEGWSADDKRPAIVFFFGGGWSSGNPNQFYAHSRDLAALGMVAISAEYRVKSRHGTSPLACVEDGKSAVRYLRANAKKWGIDPNRIVAAGGSAGGHVAACTGVLKGFDAKSEDGSISSVPNLMILYNPVIDTSPKNGYGAKRVPGDDPLIISPLHHVHKDQPPSLTFHGDADTTVKIGSVRAFAKRCEKLGIVGKLVEYEGAKHSFFNHSSFRKPKDGTPDYYALIMKEAVAFLASYGYVDEKHAK
ncbi:MAG: alpha/beta hydrolase [Phycisphaeraceae bacterium]